jgi:bis(5'-nucleosyl)-tetraphosphatase (symmetrical)
MATYAIGDVQGCYDELQRLIEKLKFDPSRDRLWFVGDLVNRGKQSLEVLRLVQSMGANATAVLGNHDLHLLSQACLKPSQREANLDFARIFAAEDGPELLHWLKHRPLAHHDPDLDMLLVHAGIHPTWNVETTLRSARRVELKLRGKDAAPFLTKMYGNKPTAWSPELRGLPRLRAIVNTLTRLRFCDVRGNQAFNDKGPPGSQPVGFYPWFMVPGMARRQSRIVFGHWSTLGKFEWNGHFGLDTGCVWGGTLSAIKIKRSPKWINVKANPR